MKKIKSYNLSKFVIDSVHEAAKDDRRKDSDWLDFFLYKYFKGPDESKPKKSSVKPKFDFKGALLSLGVDESVLSDWMEVRRKKKASNTQTAFKALLTQIDKSGLSVNDAVVTAAENGWKGFKAEWVKSNEDDRSYMQEEFK